MEINAFTTKLGLFLEEQYIVKEQSFIEERAEMASRTYEEAIKNGDNTIIAMEKSNETLFKGLHFSPINFIQDLLEREFEIKEDELTIFATQMYQRNTTLFHKYNYEDQFFIGSDREDLLYTELVGNIQFYLEDNGLQ